MQRRAVDSLAERGTDIAFRALVTVVDRGIEHVHSGVERGGDRFRVGPIGGIIGLAEIGAESDGGKP